MTLVPHLFPDFIRSIVAFAVVLGVLVTVHELGHYLAARWRGVGVEVFSIGFGRPIASWTDRLGTVWKLGWIPLGGYVKMHGQERPEDVPDEVRQSWDPRRTFQGKPVGSRAIIVAAGPIANFVLAAVLFTGLFMAVGRPIVAPVVGQVLENSAASRAGMMVGDRITTIGGDKIKTFADLQRIVSTHPGDALTITVLRAGKPVVLQVTTEARDDAGHRIGLLGVSGGTTEYLPVSPLAAVTGGIQQTWMVGAQTLGGIAEMVSGQRGTDELGGPIRIAQLSGQVALLGFANLVSFIALLSVNIGLINLFPIPVLDGGHLLFFAAEAVRGRPIPQRAQEYGFRAGLALLACLFVFATWNDISHLGIVRMLSGHG
jgi:regulator of sigma E protease